MNAYMLNGSLNEFLSSPWIIVAIIVLIFGIALAMLARPITESITKSEFDKNSRAYKNTVVISLIVICVGILFFIVGTAILAGLF